MKKWLKYSLSTLGVVGLGLGIAAYSVYQNIGDLPDGKRFEHLPYYQNGQFQSPEPLVFYADKVTGEGSWVPHKPYAPKSPLPVVNLDKNSFGSPEDLAYYWLGHSSAILELNKQRILIDPVFDNAAPIALPFLVPRFQPAPLARQDLPALDVVIITHDHYDHLETATMRYLADKVPHFVTPLGVGARLQSWGVPADKITELGWGESITLAGVTYTAEPAVHYSSRWRDDRDKTLWASFVFEGAGKRLFWSGDSGYGKHFSQLGQKYGSFDLAFMEIDAANPGWPNTHMFPDQAVQASLDLNAKTMLPIHWGVFNLGKNPWDQSIKLAVQTAQTKQLRLDVPKQGEKYQPEIYQFDPWWEGVE
ncbi:multidrug transporter [Pasteurellaceae bacterium RH1A]|nr:multidrug transporter [Pasteurellaceae bacterium RH1A]